MPARNEEDFIETTIQSVEAQTIRPKAFIIVDDGSTDSTPEIIRKYPWIHLITRKDRGFRHRGAGVAGAVNQGIIEASNLVPSWEFLCKLDADIILPSDYFQRIFELLAKCENARVGIISGVVKGEKTNIEHPRGAARIYRRKTWEDIGGRLAEIHGWDTYTDLRARQFNWETRGIPEITIIQRRPTAGREQPLTVAFQVGRTMHLLGYHPLVALARGVRLCGRNLIAFIVLSLTFLFSQLNRHFLILPKDYYQFVKRVQKQRIRTTILKTLGQLIKI